MPYEDDEDRTANEVPSAISVMTKGAKMGTRNYAIKIPSSGNNVVNVMDKTAGAIRKSTGKPAGDWLIRFDKPHRGAQFEHININPKTTHVTTDPHIPISANTLGVAKSTAETLKKVNKVLVPVAIAADTIRVGYNVYQDVKNDTTRNTVKSASSVAGGWGGGTGGAMLGASIGSAVFPGVGTIVGGIVGGIAGGISGAVAAEATVDAIGDANDWDIIICKCKSCGKKYKCRKYNGDSRYYCPDCRDS